MILNDLKSILQTIFPPTIWDIIDIAVLSYMIYQIIRFMRETRAGGLFKGVIVILAFYLVAKGVEMKAVTYVLENAFNVGIIAILILFQPELRRSLERVGHSKLSKIPLLTPFGGESSFSDNSPWANAIEAVCEACEDLSSTTTGALIVIERETALGEQIENGTIVNAEPSKQLFGNIFFKNSPLHDGAVIMRDGKILAAACTLPLTKNPELVNKALGTRHKAAIGMSENSDALVVVVSEETGTISLAENGNLTRGLSRDKLKTMLRSKILPEKTDKNDKGDKKKNFLGIPSAPKRPADGADSQNDSAKGSEKE